MNLTRLFRLSLIPLIAGGQACFAADVNFDDLVNNPARFDRRTVTISGLADVEGDGFWVWRDAQALKSVDLKGGIFIAHEIPRGAEFSPYAHANLHFVRVTGMVDTRIHGHLGMDPFSIVLKKVEVLPGPRQRQFLPILAWFKNETHHNVDIEVKSPPTGAFFSLGPNGMSSAAIEKGKNTAIAKTGSGTVTARYVLTHPRSARFYDQTKRAYYLRITDNGIDPVLPSEARKHWRFYPMPDRD